MTSSKSSKKLIVTPGLGQIAEEKSNASKKTWVMLLFGGIWLVSVAIYFILQFGIEGAQYDKDIVAGVVRMRIKGLTVTNQTGSNISLTDGSMAGVTLWDSADYVDPPMEENALFVMTNFIVTYNQTQGVCDEDPKYGDCMQDSDCPAGVPVDNGNGIRTGKCVISKRKPSVKVCQVFAWCPVENRQLIRPDKAMLDDTSHFTVFIRNDITFPTFNITWNNFVEASSDKPTYLTCKYNETSDPFCPIFTMGQIVSATGSDYDDVSMRGAMIGIKITWQCYATEMENCRPQYTFNRISTDNVRKIGYKQATYFRNADGKVYRDVRNRFGIRILVETLGHCRRYNHVNVAMVLFTGISLATIVNMCIYALALVQTAQRKSQTKSKAHPAIDGQSDRDECLEGNGTRC